MVDQANLGTAFFRSSPDCEEAQETPLPLNPFLEQIRKFEKKCPDSLKNTPDCRQEQLNLQRNIDYFRCQYAHSAPTMSHLSKLLTFLRPDEFDLLREKRQVVVFDDGSFVFKRTSHHGKYTHHVKYDLCYYDPKKNSVAELIADVDVTVVLYSVKDRAVMVLDDGGEIHIIKNSSKGSFAPQKSLEIWQPEVFEELREKDGKVYALGSGFFGLCSNWYELSDSKWVKSSVEF